MIINKDGNCALFHSNLLPFIWMEVGMEGYSYLHGFGVAGR
jgi:hypothetical protein